VKAARLIEQGGRLGIDVIELDKKATG